MAKKLKTLLLYGILAMLAYTYFLPALLDQKKKEWEENGMSSVFDSLDANEDQEGQGDATDDEL